MGFFVRIIAGVGSVLDKLVICLISKKIRNKIITNVKFDLILENWQN